MHIIIRYTYYVLRITQQNKKKEEQKLDLMMFDFSFPNEMDIRHVQMDTRVDERSQFSI